MLARPTLGLIKLTVIKGDPITEGNMEKNNPEYRSVNMWAW